MLCGVLLRGAAALEPAHVPPQRLQPGAPGAGACVVAGPLAVDSSRPGAERVVVQSLHRNDLAAADIVAYAGPLAPSLEAGGRWRARDTFAAASVPDRRVVLTLRADGAAVPLRWERLDDAARAALVADHADAGPALVAWLRGQRGADLRGIAGADGLRVDAPLPGPVVNAQPWLLGPPSAGYSGVAAPGYPEFRRARQERTPLVFVGAEDGMLHALREGDGVPVLSYAPRALFGRLGALARTGAAGTAGNADAAGNAVQAWVDGSPSVGDVNVDGTAAGWRSLLFAPLGRGAKGLAVLDVSDAAFSEERPAQAVRWEFTDTDDPDMGHLVGAVQREPLHGQPRQVVRMANGRWAWLGGNGVGSAGGAASLFVLYVQGPGADGRWVAGRDYLRIPVGGGATENGLGVPFPVDSDGDGRVDAAYAADLTGKVWKIDLAAPDDRDWRPAFGGLPLFRAIDAAGAPLPITTGVLALPHPAGGHMVVFGTGRALARDDLPTDRRQSLFGVHDRPGAQEPPAAGRRRLVQRRVDGDAASGLYAVVIDQAYDRVRHDGWVLDLPRASESVLDHPEPAGGAVVFVTDFFAGLDNPAASPCITGWERALWVLNAFEGTPLARGIDLNGDGRIDGADVWLAADGKRVLVASKGLGPGGAVVRIPGSILIRRPDGVLVPQPLPSARRRGRLAWREVGE